MCVFTDFIKECTHVLFKVFEHVHNSYLEVLCLRSVAFLRAFCWLPEDTCWLGGSCLCLAMGCRNLELRGLLVSCWRYLVSSLLAASSALWLLLLTLNCRQEWRVWGFAFQPSGTTGGSP